MERDNPPIEIRWFETREQEENYVALARGFKDAVEMRSHFAAHGTPGKKIETRDEEFDEDYYRRLCLSWRLAND